MTQKNKKIEINPEFAKALSLLNSSNKSLFITGKAGTGKSTLLEYFRQSTQKQIAILAPTGVAALNVNGQTIHSFFLIPPNITPEKVPDHKLPPSRIKLIRALDMIIIDEASMLRADLLDCIDTSLRHHRNERNILFGGVQMIFIGDLFQLPPVVAGHQEKEIFKTIYKSPYFFSAKCFENLSVKMLELKKIYRQKDNDFIKLLNKIRTNTVEENDLVSLNRRHLPDFSQSAKKKLTITLNTTNAEAHEKNMFELSKLSTKQETFFGEMKGKFTKQTLPTLMELDLKINAQIMLLNNDPAGRWVNGSIGKLTDISFEPETGEDFLEIKLSSDKTVKVKRHSWNIYSYFYNEKKNIIDIEIVGSFKQFPVRLAWAVTIHKSQGKTFDNVIIDIGRGTFAHGQIYVALSRCTNFEGIVLKKPIQKRHILVDKTISEYFSNNRDHKSLRLEKVFDAIKLKF